MSTTAGNTASPVDHASLRTGDPIEVYHSDGSLLYRGEVDLAVPRQGIVWIRHGRLKERKLLLVTEHKLCVQHPHHQERSTPTNQ